LSNPADRSIASVFCGGRRSGKTLSTSIEGCIALLCGKNVWANYPLSIGYRDNLGILHTYKANMIDMPDIIEMQKRNVIRDGLVLLDEWNLFCNARRATALANVIFSGVVQLIGKRKLSLYITTQDFNTLDRNIRWQCDITVNCFDLSFKYPNLQEGAVISQRITDWSGVLTGRAINSNDDYMAVARNTKTRLVRGKPYWDCYPTGFEYDVLEIMSNQYKLERREKVIEYMKDGDGFKGKLFDELKNNMIRSNTFKMSESDMIKSLEGMGIIGGLDGDNGLLLKKAGFRRNKYGDFSIPKRRLSDE